MLQLIIGLFEWKEMINAIFIILYVFRISYGLSIVPGSKMRTGSCSRSHNWK